MPSKRQKSLQKILAAQVRRYRDDAGLTQEQLADRCDLSRDMISRIERGTISCSLDTVAKLSEVLFISPSVLLGGPTLTEHPKSQREKALQQILRVLDSVETKDLPWIESALRVLLKR